MTTELTFVIYEDSATYSVEKGRMACLEHILSDMRESIAETPDEPISRREAVDILAVVIFRCTHGDEGGHDGRMLLAWGKKANGGERTHLTEVYSRIVGSFAEEVAASSDLTTFPADWV